MFSTAVRSDFCIQSCVYYPRFIKYWHYKFYQVRKIIKRKRKFLTKIFEREKRTMLAHHMQGKKKQIVGQAGILPVLFARKMWCDVFRDRPVIWFVDDSARYGLIKGQSPEPQSVIMLGLFARRTPGPPPTPGSRE